MERWKHKGEPAGDIAKILILEALYNKEKLTFENLVKELSHYLSRGTVNKYLNMLFQEGFVTREGRRGSYYIPEDKREKVKNFLAKHKLKRTTWQMIDNATPQEVEELNKKIKRLKEAVIRPLIMWLEKELKQAEKLQKTFEDSFNIARAVGSEELNALIKKVGEQARSEEFIQRLKESAIYWKDKASEMQQEIEKLKKVLEE